MRSARGLGRSLTVAAITVTAVAGVLVGAWLAFSATTGARMVVFETGSMSPSLPQGSAAVTLPVTAAEIQVGDVVTVRREGRQKPVTHRVVEVSPAEGEPGAARLVLQGDANATPDIGAYVVREAHRVVWGGPALGVVARLLKTGEVKVLLWVGAAAAVLWALWPSEGSRKDASA